MIFERLRAARSVDRDLAWLPVDRDRCEVTPPG
jgi:hypothetical protein